MSSISVPDDVPSASDDCEQLRKAFSGWGTNEDLIISILARRNAAQRKAIRESYSETYGEDLLIELDKELSSDFEVLVKLWALDPTERDVMLANGVTRESNSSGPVIVEIACARTANELLRIKKAYQGRYKRSLEEDVAHHTTGDIRKLLVPLISTYRYEGCEVDSDLAKSEAKMLGDKISDKAYCDEEIIRILSTRSKAQISATVNQYKDAFGKYINKDLKPDSGDKYLQLLRGAVKCLTRPEKYFEKLIRHAIERRGTDEATLTRAIVTRAEVDMQLIKEVFHHRDSVTLESAIAKDTGGDYERMLLALLGQIQT